MKSKIHSEYDVPASPKQVAALFSSIEGYEQLTEKVVVGLEGVTAQMEWILIADSDEPLSLESIGEVISDVTLMLGHIAAAITSMGRIAPSQETADVTRELLDRITPIYEQILAINEELSHG